MTASVKPKVGDVTTTTRKVSVCVECGYQMDECGMCSYECGLDGDSHPAGKTIVRTYRVVSTLLSEEVK